MKNCSCAFILSLVFTAAVLCLSCGGSGNDPGSVPAPAFSPAAGTYVRDQAVSIACSDTGATIYYTTDGTEPTTSSTQYTAPIEVAGYGTSRTIKAIAVSDDGASSVASAGYSIGRFVCAGRERQYFFSTYAARSDGSLDLISPDAIESGYIPSRLAISPNGSFLFATNYDHDSVSAYSIGPSGALATIGVYSTGKGPLGIAISPNGNFLYVTNCIGSGISAFSVGSDGALAAITAGILTTGGYPQGLAVSPDGKWLYVCNSGGVTVSGYSIGSDGALAANGSYTAGSAPIRIAICPNGAYLYVTNYDSAGADGLSGFSIGSDGTLTALSAGTFATGNNPRDIAFSPDGEFLYVVNITSETVSAYRRGSGGTLSAIGSYSIGSWPGDVAISPDGGFLYVANSGGAVGTNWLSAFSVGTNGALASLAAGSMELGPYPSHCLAIMP